MTDVLAPEGRAAAEILGGLEACVHCGFCLPACPTYEVTADEADSPRGRIVLMRALAHGELPADDAGLVRHLDRCLGCRGCESVCPSGVVYGPALEAARARIAETRTPPLLAQVALWVLARRLWRARPWRRSCRAWPPHSRCWPRRGLTDGRSIRRRPPRPAPVPAC